MEDNHINQVHEIVSQVIENPTFKTLIAQAVSNFNVSHDAAFSSVQATAAAATHRGSSLLPSSSAGSSQNRGASLVQNLRNLFPSTRGKVPSFTKNKNKMKHSSSSFYRDVILLENPKAICTLKGTKKSEAFSKGLALSDVKFCCEWNKEQILDYLTDQFPPHLQHPFEIMVPESGRLLAVDESRELLDGYKLKRLFQDRKAVYLRFLPNPVLFANESDTSGDSDNNNSLSTSAILSSTENIFFSSHNESTVDKLDNGEHTVDDGETKMDEEFRFQRDLDLAIERSLCESQESEEVTLNYLLLEISSSIKDDSTTLFNIYRKEVFASCMRATTRKRFDPFAKICVKFTDRLDNSEGAVDAGGPTREMFRILLKELENGTLFEGSGKKYLSLNSKALEKNEYFEGGKLIALAIVHVGQGPTFFSDLLFQVLVNGIHATKPTEEFIDETVLQTIQNFRNTTKLETLQDLIVNDTIFTLAGIHFIYKLEEKEEIIERILKFFCFYRVKAAIDQFVEGLKTCGIYNLMVKHHHLFYPLMCTDPPLTSAAVLDLFEVAYSPSGSNKREVETKIMSFWRDYVLDCEEVDTDEDGVTLEEILIFVTGSRNIPPLGFNEKPSIVFEHTALFLDEPTETCDTRIRYFPEANTCALQLHLPVFHKLYATFKEDMDFGIKNAKVFGRA